MSPSLWYALTGVGLFALGLYALAVHRHLLRKTLAFNVMGSGAFLVLAGLAHGGGGAPADPVPHALVITGVVVAVAATALALVLTLRVREATGQAVLHEDPSD